MGIVILLFPYFFTVNSSFFHKLQKIAIVDIEIQQSGNSEIIYMVTPSQYTIRTGLHSTYHIKTPSKKMCKQIILVPN